MIDTVELRIHDLDKYQHIEQFLTKETVHGKTRYLKFIGDTEFILKSRKIMLRETAYHDTAITRVENHYNKHFVPSSHYFIVYKIDPLKNFIHFNFSIPKLLYGTNIMQFVLDCFHPYFDRGKHNTIEQQINEFPKRFRKVIEYCFIEMFGLTGLVEFQDVEIRRLDFCYNQLFDSKQQALENLEAKMRFKFPKVKSTSNTMQMYNTSISYKSTTGKYFKIYHKGSEYASNDIKHHVRMVEGLNKQSNPVKYFKKQQEYHVFKNSIGGTVKLPIKPIFNVTYLQELADKILRYEITYRPNDISVYFLNHIFRKKCRIWQNEYRNYRQLKRKQDKGEQLTKQEKYIFNKVQQYYNKTFSFRLDGTKEQLNWMRKTSIDADVKTELPITDTILKLLAKKFFMYVKHYQIKHLPTTAEFENRLKNHNEKARRYKASKKKQDSWIFDCNDEEIAEFQVPKMMMIFELLKNYSWDEIKQHKFFSRTTHYRYKKQFESLGITRNMIKTKVAKETILDYSKYFTEIEHNRKKVLNKKINDTVFVI